MAQLEDLKRGAQVLGILADSPMTTVDVKRIVALARVVVLVAEGTPG